MKIYCTVKELGQLVRACEKGQCYACALRDICREELEGHLLIEDFVTAETIMKEESEDGNHQNDRNGIQPDYEDMYPGLEQR